MDRIGKYAKAKYGEQDSKMLHLIEDYNSPLLSLFMACADGNKKGIPRNLTRMKALLATCDVNERAYGGTALLYAAETGRKEIVQLLLDAGADPNISGDHGVTPLHRASYYEHATIVEILIKAGALIDAKIKYRSFDIENGNTPLFYAVEQSAHDVETLLIAAGADITITNENGFTLLHQAVYYRNEVMMRFLIEEWYFEVSAKTRAGDTPLHFVASYESCHDMIKYLLDHKADINAVNARGYTPLHNAVHFGHEDAIKKLLEHGADKNTVTGDGKRPFDLVKKHAHHHLKYSNYCSRQVCKEDVIHAC